MTDEVAKRDKRLLPPVYFLLATILMLAATPRDLNTKA
jgi:hypothetical protein